MAGANHLVEVLHDLLTAASTNVHPHQQGAKKIGIRSQGSELGIVGTNFAGYYIVETRGSRTELPALVQRINLSANATDKIEDLWRSLYHRACCASNRSFAD